MKRMKYTAPKCTGLTKLGHPCHNRIIEGDRCWLHRLSQVEVDPRKALVVKAFKCPYCDCLVEIP